MVPGITFLVPGITLLVPNRNLLGFYTEGSTWNPKGFYLEPKRVVATAEPKKGFPIGTAE